jgi:hypothetical protein
MTSNDSPTDHDSSGIGQPATITHDPEDGVERAVWTLLDIIDVAAGHEDHDPDLARGYYRVAEGYAGNVARLMNTGTMDGASR